MKHRFNKTKFYRSIAAGLTWVTSLSYMAPTTFAALEPGSDRGSTQIAAIANPVLKGAAGSDLAGAESGSLFYQILGGILRFMMILGAVLVLINLLQAAIAWISSGGDSSKVEEARGRMTDAVIGLVILSSSYAIWLLIKNFLGVDLSFTLLTNPG